MSKFIYYCLFLFVVLFFPWRINAQTEKESEYKFKAVYVYNFLQFIDWPPESFHEDSSSVTIGVLGNYQFADILEQTVKNETIKGRKINVRKLSGSDDIKGCQLLFIAKTEDRRLQDILNKTAGKPVLTVSEVDGFAEAGGGINFFLQSNKLRFEINVNAIKKANLLVSSKLLRLAKIVD